MVLWNFSLLHHLNYNIHVHAATSPHLLCRIISVGIVTSVYGINMLFRCILLLYIMYIIQLGFTDAYAFCVIADTGKINLLCMEYSCPCVRSSSSCALPGYLSVMLPFSVSWRWALPPQLDSVWSNRKWHHAFMIWPFPVLSHQRGLIFHP